MSSCLEKMTIVLLSNAPFEEPLDIGDEVFQIPAKNLSPSSFEIWQKVTSNWLELESESYFTRTDGTKISASELNERLNAGLNWPGPLEFANLRFLVVALPAMQQTIITIEEKLTGAKGSWDKWIAPFVSEPAFVQAWVIGADYDFWQNASDPIEYQVAGRNFSHLPMKSNGFPFPLEAKIIDTSYNPARVEIKSGYVEAIGTEMWIGHNLMLRLGKRLNKFPQIHENFSFHYITSNVFRIVSPVLFDDAEASSQIQRNFRCFLYD